MNNETRINAWNEALEIAKGFIPVEVYREISDFINKHDVWGVGIESLIGYLCEEKCTLTLIQFEKLHKAMEITGFGKSERLKELSTNVTNT